jgi:hypothetical protein
MSSSLGSSPFSKGPGNRRSSGQSFKTALSTSPLTVGGNVKTGISKTKKSPFKGKEEVTNKKKLKGNFVLKL